MSNDEYQQGSKEITSIFFNIYTIGNLIELYCLVQTQQLLHLKMDTSLHSVIQMLFTRGVLWHFRLRVAIQKF